MLGLGCSVADAPFEGSCVALTEGYRDPLGRPDLAMLRCGAPEAATEVIVVTDPTVSWPVFRSADGVVSSENHLLDRASEISPGTYYFDPEADRVLWLTGSTPAVLMSFSSSDPTSFAPLRTWVRFDPATGAITGIAKGDTDPASPAPEALTAPR